MHNNTAGFCYVCGLPNAPLPQQGNTCPGASDTHGREKTLRRDSDITLMIERNNRRFARHPQLLSKPQRRGRRK